MAFLIGRTLVTGEGDDALYRHRNIGFYKAFLTSEEFFKQEMDLSCYISEHAEKGYVHFL